MRMTLARPIILSLIAAFFAQALAHASQQPQQPAQDRKVIIIVADTATWEEYTSGWAPFMSRWLPECAVGLMNTRVQGLPTPPAAYLTLGAGSRAAAELNPELAEFALNYNERCGSVSGGDLFHARMGRRLPPGAVGYLGLPSVERENAGAMYPLRVGLMGEALRQAGLKAAAIGNSDLPDRYRRQIVTMVMDEAGVVSGGNIGPGMYALAPDREPPLMTDYRALEAAFNSALAGSQVVAVETGDLSRLAEQVDLLTPERLAESRLAAISRMDGFVRRVVNNMRGRAWRLYLLAPCAMPGPDDRQPFLTPVAAWGEGIRPGLLTSPSTRRAGVVVNTDFAASVLEFLGVRTPPETVGRPMRAVMPPGPDALGYLMRLQREQDRIEARRPYVLKGLSALLVAILAIVSAVLILAGPLPSGVIAGLREAALLALAFPLAALLLPGGIALPAAAMLPAAVALAAVMYALARVCSRWLAPWTSLAAAFTILVCADLALGQRLVGSSLLGYSLTTGARFYGLGNELGGVLLAAAPLAVAGGLSALRSGRAQRAAAAVTLAAVAAIIAHPSLGANFGIALSAVLGFAVVVLAVHRTRITGRQVLVAATITALGALVVTGLDWHGASSNRTHIGRAVEAVEQTGPLAAVMIVGRKAALNWLLVRHSIATWVLVSALTAMAGATMGRTRALSEQAPAGSPLAAGLMGAAVGSPASFFLNDSGLLSAAWGLAFVSATIAYLVFDWRLRQGVVKLD
jgi:hypothetical protein